MKALKKTTYFCLLLMIAGGAMGMTCEDPAAPMPVPGTGDPDPTNPGDNPGDTPGNEPFDVTGIWKRVTGDFGYASLDYGGELEYLLIESEGRAKVTIRNADSRALVCIPAVCVRLADDALLFDFGAGGFGDAGLYGSTVALHKMPDNDTLELTEGDGRVSTFHREASVADEDLCHRFDEIDFFENNLQPDYDTGLVFDGTDLMFTDEDEEIQRINPETGEVLTPLALPQPRFDYIEAVQGDDLWLEDDSSGDVMLERRTRANVLVDEIKRSELGLTDFRFNCAAFDHVNKILYAFGSDDQTGVPQIAKIDAEVEPDVLIEKVELQVEINAMTFDGENLIAIADYPPYVYRIETDTYKVVESIHATHRLDADFFAIAYADGAIFLLGYQYTPFSYGKAIISKVVPAE